MACKKEERLRNILANAFEDVEFDKTNIEYYLYSELFCLLHDEKDYCNCEEKKNGN